MYKSQSRPPNRHPSRASRPQGGGRPTGNSRPQRGDQTSAAHSRDYHRRPIEDESSGEGSYERTPSGGRPGERWSRPQAKRVNTNRHRSRAPQRPQAQNTDPNMVRLNKFIALSGVCSRRRADELILAGEVRVNGKTIKELGSRININNDKVFVENKPIRPAVDKVYVAFHKPVQVLTTMNDPEGRPSLAEYFAKAKIRIFPVGRLDWDSEGLLLLTNNGEFANQVAHPKNGVAKTYLVKLNGQPTQEQLSKLTRGISIIGGKTKALYVEKMPNRGADKYDWIKIIINEGRNRQIRYMIEKIGFDVKKLQRTAIGALKIGSLEKGKFRVLTEEDLEKVFQLPKELRPVVKNSGNVQTK